MKKSWIVLLVVIISLIQISLVAAQEPYHLKLLAVEQSGDTYRGSDADLFLELKKGSGRVFLDTFPLTKIDTQASTRFAKEIACNHFKLKCSKYDFIYTIKAKSNIIGGPSAGAAVAALTTIALLDLDYDIGVTITGTINSGGIVGQVGGVKEKLEAASNISMKKVLVVKGTVKIPDTNETNETQFDLIKYAKENLSLEAIEVMDLDEVLFHLTGINLNHKDVFVEENPEYKQIMRKLQNLLCTRADKLEKDMKDEEIEFNETFQEIVDQRKEFAENSTLKEDFYSAASYCFGLNILLKEYDYQKKELNLNEINNSVLILEKKVNSFEKRLFSQSIETITDLQTLIVVKERLDDVKAQIKKFKDMGNEVQRSEASSTVKPVSKGSEEPVEDLEEAYYLLAYAEERYYSAISWMQFFAMDGKKLVLDKEVLQKTCQQKISEANERHQYASIFIGDFSTMKVKQKIDSANEALNNGEFDLCLIKAIQAKGEANAILSVLGLHEDSFPDFINSKLKAVERVIADNSAEGMFPILGYSYFQYANSLKEQEKYTTLIYLEYALEMSDLGIYFPEEKTFFELIPFSYYDDEFKFVGIGFVLGVIVTLFVIYYVDTKKFKKYIKSLIGK